MLSLRRSRTNLRAAQVSHECGCVLMWRVECFVACPPCHAFPHVFLVLLDAGGADTRDNKARRPLRGNNLAQRTLHRQVHVVIISWPYGLDLCTHDSVVSVLARDLVEEDEAAPAALEGSVMPVRSAGVI
eukprot:jgi/Tetstr1/434114/TSEL_023258.t1